MESGAYRVAGSSGVIRAAQALLIAALVATTAATGATSAATGATRAATGATAQLPAAIYTDPPADKAHPARMASVTIPSHGASMNAVWYLAAGAGPHPAVLLLHGLPGNERNFDLAQAIRRAGWDVLVFHYRGAWGSGGDFSLAHAVEDTDAALAYIGSPEAAKARGGAGDGRVVAIGHSMGGYMAAAPAAKAGEVVGVGLLAPWNICCEEVPPPGEDRRAWAAQAFDDVPGRLAGATPDTLVDELGDFKGQDLRTPAMAIGGKRLLVISTDDGAAAQAAAIAAAAKAAGNRDVLYSHMTTDHSFSDHRVALQAAVLIWLAGFGR